MPTKTDRILGYLPRTFSPAPVNSPLRAIVDAFGSELQKAENSLAAVMQSHWVDHADRGAKIIDDLACLASLYGLAPRADEGVEEFREHLKRHVRTFVEGPATVQGILRTAAETLGIHIDDDYDHMDSWWMRGNDYLETMEPRGEDAAQYIFGSGSMKSRGEAAMPAAVRGAVDLSSPSDLRGGSMLGLIVDGGDQVQINLAEGAENLSAVSLAEIRDVINEKTTAVASDDGRYLTISSPTKGPGSSLELPDLPGDAAGAVLGLPPRIYHGNDESPAEVTGTEDLSGGADMGVERYIRLIIDGVHAAEIDCAGIVPENTSLDEIRDAINSALDMDIASHDGRWINLQSPTKGFNSSISLEPPASQDATSLIFGPIPSFFIGNDARPAVVVGKEDLRQGADLSERSDIRLRVEGVAYNINCAGADSASTKLQEIVDAINEETGSSIASHDGRFITLTSASAGSSSEIAFEFPPGGDASEVIFGIPSRSFRGTAAKGAVVLSREIPSGADLRAMHVINLSMDGRGPVQIDLAARSTDPEVATLTQMRDAINNTLNEEVASHDGRRLILTSPTANGGSSLAIEPLQFVCRRRFVTRAVVTDEAAMAAFGFIRKEAVGEPDTRARIVGISDISGGVDLRNGQYLRISLDGRPGVDVDCGVPRVRAALIDEIVKAINDGLSAGQEHRVNVAFTDGKHLILASPTSGRESRIALEPPRAADALDSLLSVPPGDYRGRAATGVSFEGLVNLSEGLDLDPGSAVKIGIDGNAPVEIALAGPMSLDQIVAVIGEELGPGIAVHDGRRITLNSPTTGAGSGIVFESPSGPDATEAVFGISPPRTYHGQSETAAVVEGKVDLSDGIDLKRKYILRISIDGSAFSDVDCAPEVPGKEAATLDEVVQTINATMPGAASGIGGHLVLSSSLTGASGSISIDHSTSEDARSVLLGGVEGTAEGKDPTPATLTGDSVSTGPADLSRRRILRLSLDSGKPEDIDVAGVDPGRTFVDEVAQALNAALGSQLADISDEGKLRITSPSTGLGSRVSLLPLRYLEVVEYPPVERRWPGDGPLSVRHGEGWHVENRGAADVFAGIDLAAPKGTFGPAFVNLSSGWQIRLLAALRVGDKVQIRHSSNGGVSVLVIPTNGTALPLPDDRILVGPIGTQVWVPFEGERALTGSDGEPAGIQLNNPSGSKILTLRARGSVARGALTISVTQSDLATLEPGSHGDGLTGRVMEVPEGFNLADAGGAMIARLRAATDLSHYTGKTVVAAGELYHDDPDLMIAEKIEEIFDVTLRSGEALEIYRGVTIGSNEGPNSLLLQVNSQSSLAGALQEEKGTALDLPKGRSEWRYMDCQGARFDMVNFDESRFAGDFCTDRAVFNVSRFAGLPGETVCAVYAGAGDISDPGVDIEFVWADYKPGCFTVNLPADLPERFGGSFNSIRLGGGEPETYPGSVVEPVDDPRYLVKLLEASRLVRAERAPRVPLGWEVVNLPFGEPVRLKGGAEGSPARVYLAEEGIDDFIVISALMDGDRGNGIAITARRGGPAMYDFTVTYAGARFENARATVLGIGPNIETLPCKKGGSAAEAPGPVGILKAKAAGVQAGVTRDRTYPNFCKQD
jgi:hypothetical protein